MDLKAIIFDLDGVLTDTADLHFIAWKDIANTLGIELTEEDNEQLKGLSRRASLDKILEIGNQSVPEAEKTVLTDKKNGHYQELLNDLNEEDTLIGVPEFLEDAKQNRLKIAVGSASRNAKKILEQLGISPLFDAIADGTMVTKSKPDPEVFLLAADSLNEKPENIVVFEDSIAGIQAANAAGFFSVGIGDEKTLSEADVVIPNLANFTIADLKEVVNKKSK